MFALLTLLLAMFEDGVFVTQAHLIGVLAWLTGLIGAMGAFIANLIKREMDQHDADRRMFKEQQDADRKMFEEALREFAVNGKRVDEMLRMMEQQNANVLKMLADVTRPKA